MTFTFITKCNKLDFGGNDTATGSIGKRTLVADPLLARKKQATLSEQSKAA
jgi:hypothetical protein